MDYEEFAEWLLAVMVAAALMLFVVMVAAALMLLAVDIKHEIRRVHEYYRRRVRRGGSGGKASIEELLASIPDVAYRELPAGDDDAAGGVADDGSCYRDSCAICVTPYEAGDPCSVLPGCAHMFHKPCVAEWLRKENTCPLCRGTVGGMTVHPQPRRQAGVLNAAENMV